jgi:hypothetical protein
MPRALSPMSFPPPSEFIEFVQAQSQATIEYMRLLVPQAMSFVLPSTSASVCVRGSGTVAPIDEVPMSPQGHVLPPWRRVESTTAQAEAIPNGATSASSMAGGGSDGGGGGGDQCNEPSCLNKGSTICPQRMCGQHCHLPACPRHQAEWAHEIAEKPRRLRAPRSAGKSSKTSYNAMKACSNNAKTGQLRSYQ